jgi:hypothetical protein
MRLKSADQSMITDVSRLLVPLIQRFLRTGVRRNSPVVGVRRGKAALSSGCKAQEQPARLQI